MYVFAAMWGVRDCTHLHLPPDKASVAPRGLPRIHGTRVYLALCGG